MFAYIGSFWTKKEDNYKKTDGDPVDIDKKDTKDYSITIEEKKDPDSDSDSYMESESDIDDYPDLFRAEKFRKLWKYQDHCTHFGIYHKMNEIFDTNKRKIYEDYFNNKNIQDWVINLLYYNDINMEGNNEKNKYENIFCLKDQLECLNDNDKHTFEISKDIYSIIQYNFCLLSIIACPIKKVAKFNIINKLNNKKIECCCDDMDIILSKKNGKLKSNTFIIITNTSSSYYKNNSIRDFFEIPIEFILFILSSTIDCEELQKYEWGFFKL